AIVCIEDLQIKNMTRTAQGTLQRQGRLVGRKRGLNRSILDQGWYEFRRQLTYKLAWHGAVLVAVPPHHTSQTCPHCAYVSPLNRRTQADFECVACGHKQHADVVGARNILERGLRLLACGEPVQRGHSVKQEPAEATRKYC
uniref:RNA-guided endonuclease InsQ/TnpB family protein n=1 Tax=Pseudoduganella sp. OTU4001 TaxID=3043854 RepID=UPI00313DED4A